MVRYKSIGDIVFLARRFHKDTDSFDVPRPLINDKFHYYNYRNFGRYNKNAPLNSHITYKHTHTSQYWT